MRTDSAIQHDVEEELRFDPSINSNDIAVTVESGVVMLTGFVHSYSDKLQAERDAKRVLGVTGLANDIKVRLPATDQRPDPEIARDILASFKTELPLTWERIKVLVNGGHVTLEGEVEWNYQRDRALSVALRVKGVKGVTNSILMKPPVTPVEVKRKIEEALRRSAEVDAHRIQVETTGGDVVLRGTVRTWAEREEAARAAWAAPGVRHVDNRITVSP